MGERRAWDLLDAEMSPTAKNGSATSAVRRQVSELAPLLLVHQWPLSDGEIGGLGVCEWKLASRRGLRPWGTDRHHFCVIGRGFAPMRDQFPRVPPPPTALRRHPRVRPRGRPSSLE